MSGNDTNTDGSGHVGQVPLNGATSEDNIMDSLIQAALAKVSTMKVVKIVKVTNTGDLSPVGFVDVVILTNLVDGVLGSAMAQDTIHDIPYFRLQGGKNAIIIDPVVDDIGFMMCADRDISAVKSAKAAAPPGSFRRFSPADGIYIGGILNATPEKYIRFDDDAVTIGNTSANQIQLKDDGTHVIGNLFIQGNLQMSGSIVDIAGGRYAGNISTSGEITAKTIPLSTHHHTAQGATAPTTGPQP